MNSLIDKMASQIIDLTWGGGFDNLTSTTRWILGAMQANDLKAHYFLVNQGQIFKQRLKALYSLLEEWKDQYPDSYREVFLAEGCVPCQPLGDALDWIDMIYLMEEESVIAEKTKEYALSVEEIRYTNSQWVSLLMQNAQYKETLMAQLADMAKRVSEDNRKTLTEVSTAETIEVLKQETQKALEGIERRKPIDVVYVEFDQSKQKLSFKKGERMNVEELEEMDKMEVLTFYTRDYKDNLISEIADTVMELKEIAELPRDAYVVLFFLKGYKVEDFSKLTEEKVPLFKAKLKELYEQVERWKEIDPVVYATVFQFERSISYPSLDELYELVDLLVHQNHNPPTGTIASTLNAEGIKVIEYTYLRWAMELHRCNERYAKRFLEDCERDLEKEMKAYRESLGDSWVPPKKPTEEEIKEMAKDLAITLIEREQKKEQERKCQ
jgi:hypothetical protein|nr:MAG TPA: hypothetical protein [Caudoviricetes sp.]